MISGLLVFENIFGAQGVFPPQEHAWHCELSFFPRIIGVLSVYSGPKNFEPLLFIEGAEKYSWKWQP